MDLGRAGAGAPDVPAGNTLGTACGTTGVRCGDLGDFGEKLLLLFWGDFRQGSLVGEKQQVVAVQRVEEEPSGSLGRLGEAGDEAEDELEEPGRFRGGGRTFWAPTQGCSCSFRPGAGREGDLGEGDLAAAAESGGKAWKAFRKSSRTGDGHGVGGGTTC